MDDLPPADATSAPAPRPRGGRRALLGGAAVLGVGAVLAALHEARPLLRAEASLPDSARLGHLLRRAGFGASSAELATYEKLGLAATTDRLINYTALPNPVVDKF